MPKTLSQCATTESAEGASQHAAWEARVHRHPGPNHTPLEAARGQGSMLPGGTLVTDPSGSACASGRFSSTA
jgi:hypothetical protein